MEMHQMRPWRLKTPTSHRSASGRTWKERDLSIAVSHRDRESFEPILTFASLLIGVSQKLFLTSTVRLHVSLKNWRVASHATTASWQRAEIAKDRFDASCGTTGHNNDCCWVRYDRQLSWRFSRNTWLDLENFCYGREPKKAVNQKMNGSKS